MPPPETPSVLAKCKSSYKLWHDYFENFPRTYRHGLGQKIDLLFIELLEAIYQTVFAGEKGHKVIFLNNALGKLNLLSFFFQVAWEHKYIDNKKFALLSEKLNEVGKMLGGWRKQLLQKTP